MMVPQPASHPKSCTPIYPSAPSTHTLTHPHPTLCTNTSQDQRTSIPHPSALTIQLQCTPILHPHPPPQYVPSFKVEMTLVPRASYYSSQHPSCLLSCPQDRAPQILSPISLAPQTQCHSLGDSPLNHTTHPWPEPKGFTLKRTRETEATPVGGRSRFAGGLQERREERMEKSRQLRERRASLGRGVVITEHLLPARPELGEKRGRMPESSSSAHFQRFRSSTLLLTPLSMLTCPAPVGPGSVFSSATRSADRHRHRVSGCEHQGCQTGLAASSHVISHSGHSP